jgi:hypothetical protein
MTGALSSLKRHPERLAISSNSASKAPAELHAIDTVELPPLPQTHKPDSIGDRSRKLAGDRTSSKRIRQIAFREAQSSHAVAQDGIIGSRFEAVNRLRMFAV